MRRGCCFFYWRTHGSALPPYGNNLPLMLLFFFFFACAVRLLNINQLSCCGVFGFLTDLCLFLRLQQLDEENGELRSCVPCLRANIERLEEVMTSLSRCFVFSLLWSYHNISLAFTCRDCSSEMTTQARLPQHNMFHRNLQAKTF